MIGLRVLSPLLLGVLAAGCSVLPTYRLTRTAPQKDVLSCVVHMKERAQPAVYQKIALMEIERIRAEDGRRQFPLYEVTFDFLGSGSQRLARVVVYLPEEPPEAPSQMANALPPKIETILY
jgi:hypothetical protein